ncbi:hypothetical protein FACS1894186_4840 [Alphaproteobacteria bacterium]|nr:hypothetical protein FACS1894186_4840 [Alphaproteobacteria bacterium]
MANDTTGFGLALVQGKEASTHAEITVAYQPATDTAASFVGDAVKFTGAVNTQAIHGINAGFASVMTPTAAADHIDGVVVGFVPKDIMAPTYGVASTDRLLFVLRAPESETFAIRASGALPANFVGKDASMTVAAGSQATGLSGYLLNVATIAADPALPLHIVGVSKDYDNENSANAILLVKINPAVPAAA